jgi:hypothetical protein
LPPQEMTPQNPNMPWRLQVVEDLQRQDHATIGVVKELVAKHELEIHGDRGINDTLTELATQLKWVQRSLWGLAASVTVAAIVFALGTLSGHA